MALLEGQQLGPYQVQRQMGSGGMATVYRAYHPRLDRHVAIKVMHEAFQQDENFLARFEREAQIVARLEHANIVPIYDFADIEGRPYLVMKHIDGQTLKALLFRNPPTLEAIRAMLPPIADALDYAHRQGILHRDIKPSNIIIDPQGTPYLTDFGLARIAQLGESTLSQDVILGTPQYISPEQAMGKRDLTPSTDLYSLGIVLYEIVVGQVPYSSDTPFATIHDHIYRALPKPSQINPELPPQLDAVLEKALSKRPEDRYRSAGDMVQAFLAALATSDLTSLNPNRRAIASDSLVRLREGGFEEGGYEEDNVPTTPLPIEQGRPHSAAPASAPPADTQPEQDQPSDERAARTPRRAGPPSGPSGFQMPRPPSPPAPPSPPGGRREKRKIEATFDFGDVNWSQIGQRVGSVIEEVADTVEKAVDKNAATDILARDPDSIRRRVEQEFKKRGEFITHLVIFILVHVLLFAIWGGASDGAGFPWPLIVFFGWGSGVVAHAIETFYETGRRLRRRAEAVEHELIRTFGEDWSRVADKKQIKAIRKRVEAPSKKIEEFYQHFGVYVMINLMLWMIFVFSALDGLPFLGGFADMIQDAPFPWPLFVTVGWGIGLVANAMEALNAGAHERAVQREIAREEARLRSEKPKREAESLMLDEESAVRGVRLTEDGEFTDSMIQELQDEDRPRRSRR
ncbi:MAG: protein kinase [Chloroflexi bacterium]|nr:protein kinase [Chloroflexota bacterium]